MTEEYINSSINYYAKTKLNYCIGHGQIDYLIKTETCYNYDLLDIITGHLRIIMMEDNPLLRQEDTELPFVNASPIQKCMAYIYGKNQ